MRSFAGRDIPSLKGCEREEFFHVFEICGRMAPIVKERRNADLLKDKSPALLSLVLGAVEYGEGGSETGDG